MTYVIVDAAAKHFATLEQAEYKATWHAKQQKRPFYIAKLVECVEASEVTITKLDQQPCAQQQATSRAVELLTGVNKPSPGGPWLSVDDKLLTTLWSSNMITASYLAELFNRSEHAIYCRLEKLGLLKN